MESSRGFSLLELTVSLALSSILIASAFATIPALLRKQRLCHETQRVQLLIDRARARAVILGLSHSVILDGSHITLYDSFKNFIEMLSLRHGIQLSYSTNISQELFLYPTLSATPATLTLTLGVLSSQVVISLRGRTRIVC